MWSVMTLFYTGHFSLLQIALHHFYWGPKSYIEKEKNRRYIDISFLGDVTEDPERPKHLWPSRDECPSCRPLAHWNVPLHKQHHLKSFQNQAKDIFEMPIMFTAIHAICDIQSTNVLYRRHNLVPP